VNLRGLLVFATGVLFAAGLALSGMTQPAKVIAFLDFAGAWDPSLAFVMLGAVSVHLFFYRLIVRRGAPVLAPAFAIPKNRAIDGRLLAGASIFGLGWGLAGYCPAPAFVAAGARSSPALIMAVSMAAGIALFELWDAARSRAHPAEKAA
jgi:uncharacterized membrane protein YedE/YeeE